MDENPLKSAHCLFSTTGTLASLAVIMLMLSGVSTKIGTDSLMAVRASPDDPSGNSDGWVWMMATVRSGMAPRNSCC